MADPNEVWKLVVREPEPRRRFRSTALVFARELGFVFLFYLAMLTSVIWLPLHGLLRASGRQGFVSFNRGVVYIEIGKEGFRKLQPKE